MRYHVLNREERCRRRPRMRLDRTRPHRQTGYVSVRDLKRLAEAVVARRGELGYTQAEFASRGGITVKTLQRIEKGDIAPRAKTVGAVDRAAEWRTGSVRKILSGGDPMPLEDEPAQDLYRRVVNQSDEFELQVMALDDLPLEARWDAIFAHRNRRTASDEQRRAR